MPALAVGNRVGVNEVWLLASLPRLFFTLDLDSVTEEVRSDTLEILLAQTPCHVDLANLHRRGCGHVARAGRSLLVDFFLALSRRKVVLVASLGARLQCLLRPESEEHVSWDGVLSNGRQAVISCIRPRAIATEPRVEEVADGSYDNDDC